MQHPTALGALTTEDLLMLSDGVSALIVSPADRIDAGYFEQVADSMRIVATRSVGYDHIEIDPAARRSIAVANTSGVVNDVRAASTTTRSTTTFHCPIGSPAASE